MQIRKIIAQFGLDAAINLSSNSTRIAKSVIWNLQDRFIRFVNLADVAVTYQLHGQPVQILAGSGLPSVMSRYPNFDSNLTRISAAVSRKYPDSTMIDVGANIGDSALAMRKGAICPILCIEGSQRYAEMCRRNLQPLPNIPVVQAFVDTGAPVNGRIVESKGSGRSIPDGKTTTTTVPLSALATQCNFANAKLVKIDTDGFDGRIIQASLSWIEKQRPVLFWEFELTSDRLQGGPGRAIFDLLKGAGYRDLAFYSNTGDYMASASIADTQLLEDLSWYLGERQNRDYTPPAYADICAFPEEDHDLFEQIRADGHQNHQSIP